MNPDTYLNLSSNKNKVEELIKTLENKLNTMDDIKKRIKRIFPPLILCVLAVAVIIGPMITTKGMQSYFRGTWNYISRNILLYPTYSLPGIFKGNPVSQAVNGSLWSLPIEFFCYIVIMIIGAVIRFIKKYSIVASKIICVCVFAGVVCANLNLGHRAH